MMVVARCQGDSEERRGEVSDSECVPQGKRPKATRQWKRKTGQESVEMWRRVRERGESEMKEFVEEWCAQALAMGEVDVDETWGHYRSRVVNVQADEIGRRNGRMKKSQGQWYEVFDLDLQKLKREARKVQTQIKEARAQGVETKTLHVQYRDLGLRAKKRLRHVVRVRAEAVVAQMERLK